MRISVQWARGCQHINNINLSDKVTTLIQGIATQLRLNPKNITLYYDQQCKKRIPQEGNVMNARLQDKQIIFLDYKGALPERPVAKMTTEIDASKKYLAEGEEPTNEMKRIAKDFGSRAVSVSFIEHKNNLKPNIDFQEESSCYAFRVSSECIKRFQTIALQENFSTHRVIFLFGRINEITGKVTAHCSCEPPQVNKPDRFEVDATFDIDSVCQIASYFGMKCVGMAISHKPDAKFPMLEYMIKQAALYQNKFGEYFTTLIVTPIGQNDISVEAFQVSDAAMKLDKGDYFANSDNQHVVVFKEELTVCGFKRKEADVNLLLCAVRVRQTHSKFPSHEFPSPQQEPTILDLKRYFVDHEYCPNWYALFDFNLLVFLKLNDILTLKNIQIVVNHILAKTEIPNAIMDVINNVISVVD
ncbi:nuclear protein localization 4 [Histomonas meleagridis]|uniref:nuclear protein localization 4 n=1 Tax=Histomonas meleagridis TaxID=135588 RepID=UPI00355A2CC2|nr:nuclear protein localization 4 [Histomonas meleagridis]KAH0804594.1 nuclear protein localization 4 [Histomonas meleagridis]